MVGSVLLDKSATHGACTTPRVTWPQTSTAGRKPMVFVPSICPRYSVFFAACAEVIRHAA